MMQRSEAIDQLATALVVAQAEIEGAEKDNKGNYGKYATITSVVDAIKPALNSHSLAFMQLYEPSADGELALTTLLVHTSGQWISGTATVPLPKKDPQGYGSAGTYARRYGLMALVGLCPEDDDAQAASTVPPKKHASVPASPPNPTPAVVQTPSKPEPTPLDKRRLTALDTWKENYQTGEWGIAKLRQILGMPGLARFGMTFQQATDAELDLIEAWMLTGDVQEEKPALEIVQGAVA